MLTHIFIVFIACVLTSCSRVTLPTDRPRVSLLTHRLGVSHLTDQRPSSGLTGFHRHSSWCGLRDKIDKERSSGHSGAALKILEIKSLLWPTIRKHIQRPAHIHTYLYIHVTIDRWPTTPTISTSSTTHGNPIVK